MSCCLESVNGKGIGPSASLNVNVLWLLLVFVGVFVLVWIIDPATFRISFYPWRDVDALFVRIHRQNGIFPFVYCSKKHLHRNL